MDLRRSALAASASVVAVMCASAPAFAADDASKSTNVQEVVVTGIRASLQNSINVKRRADGVVDAVSAEDIGKLPDKNVADALQRVPGVNTVSAASGEGGFDENDRVSVRGTSPSLTQTTVNGHTIANGDWFILDQFQTVGRSVSYTLLPSEMVDATLVHKSQQADLVEGGVAGSVDIITRKPLDMHDRLTMQGMVGGAYATLPNKADPQFNGILGWKNADGTLGMIAQAFYEQRHVRRDGQEFLGYQTITSGMAAGAAIPGLQGVIAPSLIGSALFTQERKREGGDLTVQWRPNSEFEVVVDGFYSKLDATNFNQNVMAWVSNELNNNVPTSYTVKNNTLVAATFPLLNPGGGVVQGYVADYIARPKAAADTWYINFDATWRPSAAFTMKTKIGTTRGRGLTPSQPAFEANANTGMSYDMSSGVAKVAFPDINASSPSSMFDGWAWSDRFTAIDQEDYAQVDGEWMLDRGVFKSLKFGARYDSHDRNVQGNVPGCAIGANGACWGAGAYPMSGVAAGTYPSDFADQFKIGGFLNQPVAADFDKVVAVVGGAMAFTPNRYYVPGSFRVNEEDSAAYVMSKIGGDRWHGNVGVRLVNTSLTSFVNTSPGPDCSSDYAPCSGGGGGFGVTKVKHDYVDVLPSASVAFDLGQDLILHTSIAKAMSRPDYSALGGAVSLNDLALSGSGGNPNLKPVRSWNYDASLEWYYGPQSLLSVGVFYMDLQSYVTFGVTPQVFFNQQQHAFTTYQVTSPFNTSGTSKGVELSWQQPLWHGFGVVSNITYADGKESDGSPLIGSSKITYNLQGYYESKKFNARLAYTYRSHFLVGLDRSTAENADNIGSLDASINYNVTPNLMLNLDAMNLTDQLLKYYGNNKTQPRAIYDNGRQLYFGVRFKY